MTCEGTMLKVPEFWISNLDHIDRQAKTARRAEVREIARSAGGRPLYAFAYGDKQIMESTANYSSACGAFDRDCYAPLPGKKPVVLLLGAVHGAEVEGTAALVNLIHCLEEGKDLRGDENEALMKAAEDIRLVIVPVCNPDGRARLPYESVLGMTMKEMRYWFQGTWKDGSLCDYPRCKKVHPIKEASDHLGSYFNDDGVNIMHDNFFRPMARETQAILGLADEEKADFVIQLHGGGNCLNCLLPTHYVTKESLVAVHDLSVLCNERAKREGLAFTVCDVPERESGETPPSFNLASALHHVCGAVSAVFESNQHAAEHPGAKLTHDEVYRSHLILFEELFGMASSRSRA